MSFTFLNPGWLILLAALPALWFFPRRLRGSEAVQTGVLRTLVLGLIVIALARPASLTGDDSSYQILVVDNSASMEGAALARANTLAAEFEADLASGTIFQRIDFGAAATAAVPVNAPESDAAAESSTETKEDSAPGSPAPSSSPIGDGLWEAARAIPAGYPGAVTLITDGLATDERWSAAVSELTSRGIPVHTISAASGASTETGAAGDARIVGLTTAPSNPSPPRVGATVILEARIVDAPAAFDIVLLDRDNELARESFTNTSPLAAVTVAAIPFEPREQGFLALRARIESSSPLGREENNSLATTLAIQPPLRVLYVGGRMQRGDEALGELVGPGFEFVQASAAELTQETTSPLMGADLVVLDDAPAAGLSNAAFAAISDAVREGGVGLFASGGAGSFGPGGWHKTPIEELLPIEFVQKEEKRDPSTTLVVIIDTSGSMGGNRVQLAKEVARLAIRRLLPHDKVGLVEFFGSKRWAVPIQPASNAIEIERALNRLNAGGGTVILPAIEEAFYGLKNVRTRYKHVLILTDGGVETGAFEPLLRSMSKDGINVSTVLIGSAAHSEFLVTLANWGKGRFYGVPNRFNLPEILLKQPTTAKLPAMRPGPHTVSGRGGKAWWGDVDPAQLPELGSYVETSIRPGAHKVIESKNEGHPIMASWNNGLGRVTTLMTEPTGPASAGWQEWDGYGQMVARALEQTSRDSRPFAFSIERHDWKVRITARSRFADRGAAFPGAIFFDEADALFGKRTEMTSGAAAPSPIEFRRMAPGWFEAELFIDPASELRLRVGDVNAAYGINGLKGLAVSTAFADVAPEFAVDPARALDLALLSSATGGAASTLGSPGDAQVPATAGGLSPQRRRALWPLALLLALATYLIELWNRRTVGGLLNRGGASAPGI